jgi:tRNA (guanine-N7-)-methyltransferase
VTKSGDSHPGDARPDLRSYGRRRGRKPSARQAALLSDVLPRVCLSLAQQAPADLRDLFVPRAEEVWLEIGFGAGEHLIWQARNHPRIGLIGCEPFEDGAVKVLGAIEGDRVDNIRLHPEDARPLLRWLPGASVARAFVLFPDPWPKKRHQKRRLVSAATLAELARVMRPGAELRLATDVADYAHWMLLAVRDAPDWRWLAARPGDWGERPADWPPTRYEQKALAAGRRCYFFRLRRT